MKHIISLFVFGVFLVLTACSSSPKPAVEAEPVAVEFTKDSLITMVQKYSYALGADVGQTLKNIGVEMDMEAFNLAVSHEMEAKPLLMTDEEIEAALESLLIQVQEMRETKAKEEAQQAKEAQANFLEKNKLDSTVKVTESGLQYKILKNGEGNSPKRTDIVKVHYVGTLLDGTEFDSSIKRGEALSFEVANVIEGWQELMTYMSPGMKVKAWIPSDIAYGEAGAEPIIPGNSLLIFEVELLEVIPSVVPELEASVPDSVEEKSEGEAPKADAKAEKAAPKADAKAEKAAPKADAKAEKAAPKADAKAEKAAPKADAKAEKAAPKADAKVEKAAPKADAKAEKAAPKADAKAEKAAPKADVKAEKAAPKADAKAEEKK